MNPRSSPLWATVILGVIALGNLLNAAWMLAAPLNWYETIPGVTDTGPYNEHFVRDIGCVYLTTGLALAWAVFRSPLRFALVAFAALFHGAHAVLHVADTAHGHVPADHWWLDLPAIYLPALLLAAVLFASARKNR